VLNAGQVQLPDAPAPAEEPAAAEEPAPGAKHNPAAAMGAGV